MIVRFYLKYCRIFLFLRKKAQNSKKRKGREKGQHRILKYAILVAPSGYAQD